MAELNDWPWLHWARERPEQQALLIDRRPCSWQQLGQRVTRLAAGFQQQGVTPGCGVALWGKNSAALLLCYLALLQCGARLLPLNPVLPETLLGQLLPALDIDFVWSETPDSGPVGIRALEMIEASPHQLPAWRAERWATMTLTSGSSGLPKAALHTCAAHLASAEGVLDILSYQPTDSWLLSLPLFHVSGQGIVWRWLRAGARLVLHPLHPLDEALQGCTHASLVPTQLWRLLSRPPDRLELKQVLLGGAAISVSLTQRARDAGISCWCGYGMTEMASTVCAKPADALPGVGLPLRGKELRLVHEEVWLRGSGLALGYWQHGKLLPLTDGDGWFHTRDRGVMEQGELRILGRLDNLFFSAGEGIQPEQIERILLNHPSVLQAFILPIDDMEFGQRPVAVLALGGESTLSEVEDWLKERVAGFQRPVRYLHLPAELAGGGIKVSRQRLMDWLRER